MPILQVVIYRGIFRVEPQYWSNKLLWYTLVPLWSLELLGHPKSYGWQMISKGPVLKIPHSYNFSSSRWSQSAHTVVILKPPGKCGSGKNLGLCYRPELSFSCNQMLESIRLPWEPQLPLIFPVPLCFQICATDTHWSTVYIPGKSSQTSENRKLPGKSA